MVAAERCDQGSSYSGVAHRMEQRGRTIRQRPRGLARMGRGRQGDSCPLDQSESAHPGRGLPNATTAAITDDCRRDAMKRVSRRSQVLIVLALLGNAVLVLACGITG